MQRRQPTHTGIDVSDEVRRVQTLVRTHPGVLGSEVAHERGKATHRRQQLPAHTGGPEVTVRALHVARVELQVFSSTRVRDQTLERLLRPNDVAETRNIRRRPVTVHVELGEVVRLVFIQARRQQLVILLELELLLQFDTLIVRQVGVAQVQVLRITASRQSADDCIRLLHGHLVEPDLLRLDRHILAQSGSRTQGEQLSQQSQTQTLLSQVVPVSLEAILRLVLGDDLTRHRILHFLQSAGRDRVTQSIRLGLTVVTHLHDLPRITVVSIRGDVQLVHEGAFQQHPLKVRKAGNHEVVRLRQRLRTTSFRPLSRSLHELHVHLGRRVKVHGVDQRQGLDRVLKAPQNFTRIAIVEEPAHAQQRRSDLLDQEVHLCHRTAADTFLVQLRRNPEDFAEEPNVVEVNRIRVTEIVLRIQRVVCDRHTLKLRHTTLTTILFVLTRQAQATGHESESEDRRQSDAASNH